MRNWGIALITIGALAILGSVVEPDEDSGGAVPMSIVFIAGGSWMTKKGQAYINLMKECSEKALHQIKEKDYIDVTELSQAFQKSEIDIRQMLTKAQKKSFIPYGATIK